MAYAETTAVNEASADRRSPCTDALCGGCLYAHIAYRRQLELKALVIADAFGRIAHLQLPAALRVAASPEEGYRMRARLHMRGRRLGFFREGTHEVCDARATGQLLPATCDVLDRVAAGIRSLGPDLVRDVELSENVDTSERVVSFEAAPGADANAMRKLAATDGLTPGPYVTDMLAIGEHSPIALRRHVLAFFQGNRYLLNGLTTHVVGQIPAGRVVLDLYAGTGLFSMAAAVARGSRVTAVEGDRLAAADLAANAATSRADVTTVHQPVEDFLSRFGRRAAETIIIDPPRTGMSKAALDGTINVGAPRIVYVSCDVATLARDARRLADAGYGLERVDAFDLFPNTPHVETVAVFGQPVA